LVVVELRHHLVWAITVLTLFLALLPHWVAGAVDIGQMEAQHQVLLAEAAGLLMVLRLQVDKGYLGKGTLAEQSQEPIQLK
jgi:hypothetical protein